MRIPRRSVALLVSVAAALLAAAPAGGVCIPARPVLSIDKARNVSFRQPSDFVLAGERIYVLDDLNERVAILDLQGRTVGTIPLPEPRGGSWLGIGFGGADRVFIAAADRGTVVVTDPAGKDVREIFVAESGEDSRPAGILVSRGSLFVTDGVNHRVRVLSLEGNLIAEWGEGGDGPGQFRVPFRVIQDSRDRVIVTDALNSRIQVFTPKGEHLLSFGEFGTTEGTLFRPAGLAIFAGDRILVSDNYFGSIQLFDSRGGYLGVLCGPNGLPLAMENPVSLAVRGGMVYVLETGAGRLSIFRIEGR